MTILKAQKAVPLYEPPSSASGGSGNDFHLCESCQCEFGPDCKKFSVLSRPGVGSSAPPPQRFGL